MSGRSIRYAVAVLVVVALTGVAAACSSGGNKDKTPTAELPTVAPTPLGAVAQKTAEAKLYHPELKEYVGPDRGFKISLPADWTYEEQSGNPSPAADASIRDADTNLLASVSVQCFPGVTGAKVLENDATGARGVMVGDLRQGDRRQVPVLDTTGDEVLWEGHLATTTIQHRSLYFTAGGCGWRIQMNTFPGATLDGFEDTWNKIVASFRPGPI